MDTEYQKLERLKNYISERGAMAVAFSGGVDSTLLLKVAHEMLGDKVLAVTAASCSFPKRELDEASHFCRTEGIRHVICESEELEIDGFSENPPNRCYLCKTELFQKIWDIADKHSITYVSEASNVDDEGDYRPGLQAVSELGVLSPLRVAGLKKQEIRNLSKALGLTTWNKPSFACLASRFVYGEEITEKKLKMVEESEQFLLDEGFYQVRVRVHGDIARIEIGKEDFSRMLASDLSGKVENKLKQLGFSYVTMDLGGYRMGSMNDSVLK